MVEIVYILDGEITFEFPDETVVATPGTMVAVPPDTRHKVTGPAGGRFISIFTPGGFDRYLAELAELTATQLVRRAPGGDPAGPGPHRRRA